MTALDIPCRRPKVTVDEFTTGAGTPGPARGFRVVCHVPTCGFCTDGHVVKAGAEEEARWHRAAHRAAVPRTHIFKPTIDRPGYYASCYECMWDTPAGVSTRTDVHASLDTHLASVHGLVSC